VHRQTRCPGKGSVSTVEAAARAHPSGGSIVRGGGAEGGGIAEVVGIGGLR
jgi:hypothetical protein